MRHYLKSFTVSLALLFLACDDDDNDADLLTAGDIETIAGKGPTENGHDGDNGMATAAKLSWVTGVAVDDQGNIYLTDGAANVVRKISSNGIINTIAGKFIEFNPSNPIYYGGDGGPATDAYLNVPFAVTIDPDGDLFIADAGNHAVRQISSGLISTMAGKGPGLSGYSGDNADASESKMWNPQALTHDNDGNIYIADTQNNAIRLVNRSTGKITTIAGLGPDNSGFSGDNGPADLAALNSPRGIAVDADGNIYISDAGNNRIRKISNGVITTIAGTGAAGYTGDNGPATNATFASLKGLAIDSDNNLYIADAGNNVIRMIEATSGNVHTVAGDGTYGFGGDGGPATQAHLANPHNVAVDKDGNLYIADTDNSAVRKVIR